MSYGFASDFDSVYDDHGLEKNFTKPPSSLTTVPS